MNEHFIIPENFNESDIKFGYYNNKGELQPIDKDTIIENNCKLYIGYLNNGIFKPLKFSYNHNNLSWRELAKCKVFYNNYFDINSKNLKLNLIMDGDKNYVKDFKNMLDKIKICSNFFIGNLIKNKKFTVTDTYTVDIKKGNTVYLNNIRFKQSFKNTDISKTTIFLKKPVNGEIIDELITDYEDIVNKFYHIIPVLHLSALYIKFTDNKISISQDVFLEEAVIYKNKPVIKKTEIKPITIINTSNLNEDDYI
jgi:hypothetical protein